MVADIGNIFPFLNSGNFSAFSDVLRWEFIPTGTDSQYFIDGLGGRNNPILSTEDTILPNMGPTTSISDLSQWIINSVGNNTYYLTTVGGTLNRLSNGGFGLYR